MMTTRHSLGTVLTQIRCILADGATAAEVLCDADVPAWYLTELERDHITRPNDELLALICQAYELSEQTVGNLRQAPHLAAAIAQIARARDHELATRLRQRMMSWPDSATTAATESVIQMSDPAAKHSYADILRCVRQRIEWCPILVSALYYRVSPMAYWQMEAAQLAVTPEVKQLLGYRLECDDLTPFLHADDLYTAICQHLDLCKKSLPVQLRLPGC
ncbi:MAG: hypothetical protein LKH74_03745 [Levilactobacillus sp.]|jgi:hypothetical protein|uniref:hypothetical protein n=1 Tax=Levilactobacillus sp. TaxID=2767919 RepID=UPI00258F26A3|nr:hypothetical protein [Levilactobacillus sp.]MCI1553014.1 hypothetical protein [Levilactobacillus sp.]MCI1598155.1 hypothetical protein [Levilactobacillus sp.]MCI1605018.1 hypothetical protein [Levilactobacillus sp.]